MAVHVLVATRRTQGQRPDDYAHTIDGEFVFVPLVECDRGGSRFGTPGRCFIGLESRGRTTTAEVIDMDVTPDDVVGYVMEKLVDPCGSDDTPVVDAHRLAIEMLTVAGHFVVGAVVEKRGDVVRARATPSARR